jgi:hypothetical protein
MRSNAKLLNRKVEIMPSLSFTNLRVLIDENVHHIYTELTERSIEKAEDAPFIKMPDLFVTAACIGAKENKYVELGKKRDIFYADAFDKKTQIPILITLAFKHIQNLDSIPDGKIILDICQAWANGGINIIYEEVLSRKGLRPLYRFTDFILEETRK